MNLLKERLCSGGNFDREQFMTPPAALGPFYTWIWNVEITREEIDAQLDEMAEGGIRATYILPEPKEFRPQTMVTDMEPAYLTPEFMELARYAMEQAQKRGIALWLYDEGGWPSGGACGQVVRQMPEAEKKMISRREIPGAEAAKLPEDSYVRVTTKDGKTLSRAEMAGEDTVWLYEVEILHGPVPQADSADEEAMKLFVELTHEKYAEYCGEYLGDLAQMMFTDEPETAMPAWPRGFAEKFLARFGYDIRDHLACLFEGDSPDPARLDYVTLLEETMRDCFIDYQRIWCNEHDLMYGGHMDVDHTFRPSSGARCCDQLYLLRGMDVPGVDAIWRQIFPYPQGHNVSDESSGYIFKEHIPEDLGKPDETTIPFFPRLASSAAAQNGHNLSLVEAFGVYGSGLTLGQMRFVIAYLAIRGLNLFNFMAISFGRKGHYVFGELPNFNHEMPCWASLPALNDWVNRLSYVGMLGERRADTALLYPVTDIALDGEHRARALKAYIAAGVALEKQGIDFDIINPRGILEGKIENGVLLLGKGRYGRIAVPEGVTLSEEVWERIRMLSGENAAVLGCADGFDTLRAQKRVCENGDSIVLLYHEGRGMLETAVTPEGAGKAYWLDLESGEMAAAEWQNGTIPLTLQEGEIRALLLTEAEYPVRSEPGEKTEEICLQLSDFEQAVVREMRLDQEGFHALRPEKAYALVQTGDWTADFGREFSGEVAYRAVFAREEQGQGIATLQAEGVRHSARVEINGQTVGHLQAAPFMCRFDADILRAGENEVVITVANTLANQHVYSGAEAYWQPRELTPYHRVEMQLQKSSIPSGFDGTVSICVYREQ